MKQSENKNNEDNMYNYIIGKMVLYWIENPLECPPEVKEAVNEVKDIISSGTSI